MGRPPQAGDASGDTGKRVGPGTGRQAHGRCRRVLFVIGMQRENAIHRTAQDRVDHVILGRHRETHAQEVGREIKVVARILERLADRVFIGPGRNGRHLGDQAVRRDFALTLVRNVCAVVIECRHRPDHAHHDGHRVRIAPEPAEKVLHLFMQHRVVGDVVLEFFKHFGRGQFAIKQKVTDFEIVRLFSQLSDGIAPVQQDTRIAVDKGDGAVTACRRGKTGIVGEHARLPIELADIDHVRPLGRGMDRQVVDIVAYRQSRGFRAVGHGVVPFVAGRRRRRSHGIRHRSFVRLPT